MSDIALFVDVGKAGKHLSQGAEIGRQHKSHALNEYEILLGDQRAVRWVEADGVPNPHNLGARHVDAGVDMHGHEIFVVQVRHNDGIHPARANSGSSGMFDPFGPRIHSQPLKESKPGSLQARTLPTAAKSWYSR